MASDFPDPFDPFAVTPPPPALVATELVLLDVPFPPSLELWEALDARYRPGGAEPIENFAGLLANHDARTVHAVIAEPEPEVTPHD